MKKINNQSKCCKEPIEKYQRYCPRCGWECYIEEKKKEETKKEETKEKEEGK